jgi:formate-nitrite transporter family protein
MVQAGEGSARPRAGHILRRVLEDADEERSRTSSGLAFSGFAAGVTMGLSGLGVAVLQNHLPHAPWATLIAYAAYPLGFIAVIMGRAQLFTENTLYPVVLVLDRRSGLLDTLRLWAVVLATNVLGILVFAALVTQTPSVRAGTEHRLVTLGLQAVRPDFYAVFWTAVIGGWLIALVAWLIEGAAEPFGQIALIWVLTFIVGLGGFAHSIATSGEILVGVLAGPISGLNYLRWLAAAVLGNAVGGVVIVALLNYGQVMAGGGRRGARKGASA